MKVSFSVLPLLLAFFFVSATTTPHLSDDLIGAWSYSVDTPDGAYKGKLIFVKNEEGYTGKMVSQAGEVALQNLEVEDKDVRFSLYVDGYLVKIKGTVEGDSFAGKVEVEYEFYPIKGQRVKEDVLAGAWNYTATTPDGIYKGQFVFTKGEEGYTGKMVIQENETTLNNIKLEDQQVSFSLSVDGYNVKVKATIDGKSLDGKGEVEYEYFPVKGEKVE